MDLTQALILSVVEGLTEFLPVSSTGHLILVSDLLNIPQTDFVKSFEIFIQLGAILAIAILYFKTLIRDFSLWLKIIVAFLPTAFIGLIFYNFIKQYLLGNSLVTTLALLIGGIILILFEFYLGKKRESLESFKQIDYKKAFLIGLFQSISIVPGVSRAGATILGGMFLGLSRKGATEFSFLLALPTMAAATILDLVKSNFRFSSSEFVLLLVGFLGSFLTALIAVKFLLKFIQTHTFIPFGFYRIALAIIFWIFILN